MRGATLCNLQCNNVARQVKRKCCTYYLAVKPCPTCNAVLMVLDPIETLRFFGFATVAIVENVISSNTNVLSSSSIIAI